MKNTISALLLSLILLSSASARLGETIEECKARYGEPTLTTPDKKTLWFKKNGIEIHIDFRDNLAVEAKYSAEGKWGNLSGSLTDESIKELLKIYAEDQKWEETETGLDQLVEKNLKRTDGKIFARWNYSPNTITFITSTEKELRANEEKALADAEKQKAKAAAETAIKGL